MLTMYFSLEKASEAAGLPVRDDFNDPTAPAQGYFHLDATVDDSGQRLSTYRAYLNKKVALEREQNLTVCTGVVASKLDVDAKAGQVTGVYIRSASSKDQKNYFVKARREVIVCNGALRTPQLLLLRYVQSIAWRNVTKVIKWNRPQEAYSLAWNHLSS